MRKTYLLFVALIAVVTLNAQIQLAPVEYTVGDVVCHGVLAKPEKITAATKTVLLVHEWWGLDDYPKNRAKQLAAEGFIVFCVDMYGGGKIAENPQDAQALATPFYKDPQLMYQRFMGGYDAALKQQGVNKDEIAAIGYCFGGSVVLNAAKMGAPLDAVVSFHGGLAGAPAEKGKLKAAVLVCNGAADTFVPQTDIDAFSANMKAVDADYTFINYDNALHAFTNPKSTENGQKFGMKIAYNEAADKKSYNDFLSFMHKKVK